MEPRTGRPPRRARPPGQVLLNRLTFGAAALSLGFLLAFIVTRGDVEGVRDGARFILFSLVLAAFVVTPYVAQRFVNARVWTQAEIIAAGIALVIAAGLGLSAYVVTLFTGRPDALDALVFFALPLWQLLIVGLGYGAGKLATWMRARRG